MPPVVLPFEKPIAELENKLNELKSASEHQELDVSEEIARMESKVAQTRKKIYGNLTAWQKVQIARHPERPYTRDYLKKMTTEFAELNGDRLYQNDRSIVGGFAKLDDVRMMIIGTQKGRDTKSNVECNFGSPFPEGYRKALRLMKLADKFKTPIVTLVDTPGAFPGLEAEERHVAEAIAVNLRESFTFSVPMLAIITGEGGSGGALGIGVANRVLVLENAYYSVITPEGCAAILWKDRAFSDRAAEALKLTAQELLEAGITDGIVPEPLGGAHTDLAAMAATLKQTILDELAPLMKLSPEQIRTDRYDRFRAIGRFEEGLGDNENGTEEPEESDPATS